MRRNTLSFLRNINLERAGAPTTADGVLKNIPVGQYWLDTSANPREVYVCTKNTAGAAVWEKTTTAAEGSMVPSGGSAYAVLAKNTGTTLDYGWLTNVPMVVVTLTPGASVTIAAASGLIHDLTADQHTTFAAPTGAVDGRKIMVRHRQGGTGSYIPVWDGVFQWTTTCPQPTFSTTVGQVDEVVWVYDGVLLKWLAHGVNLF